MPFMKVNLNGRKYVISGVSDRTSSKHILCSLARVDSTLHLETTEFSDTSIENDERTKGKRTTRTRRTRVRHSSTSSLEILEIKNSIRGTLSEKNVLIDLENSEWSEGNVILNSDKCPRKLLFTDIGKNIDIPLPEDHAMSENCHATHGEGHAKCNGCHADHAKCNECHANVEGHAKCNECHVIYSDGHATCSHAKKTEVKRRRRRLRKRPVSQDVTRWKENKEEQVELGQKGWKSADDVREPGKTFSFQDEKTRKRNEKHKKKRKSKRSHDKIDNKSCDDRTVIVNSIDSSSGVRRHVRKEIGDMRIQRMISRAIDQRFVDFHVSCLKSYAPVDHHSNEQEIRAKLIQLIESQRNCLSALDKAEKQNRKAVSRYAKYLQLDEDKIQFYSFAKEKQPTVERARKTSETDTGISELHSDSSNDSRQTHIYDAYKHDASISYVISDDFIPDDVTQKTPAKLQEANDEVNSKDVTGDDVMGDDVTIQDTQRSSFPNYVVTVDAVAIDDVTHDVQRYVYEKDDDNQSEIIVAEPTEVICVPFDQSETNCSLVPYRSAESITTSTLSDISDPSSHGNCDDVEELRKVLQQEQQKQQEKKRKIDRHCEEMRLMDLRIKEQKKMAIILERLKDLNEGLVQHENTEDKQENDFKQEKRNFEKSKKLSMNLYKYQKGEINKNSSCLQQIESQITRKRWHVESAVKELGRVVASSSRSQLDRIRSLEDLPVFASLATTADLKPKLNNTLV